MGTRYRIVSESLDCKAPNRLVNERFNPFKTRRHYTPRP